MQAFFDAFGGLALALLGAGLAAALCAIGSAKFISKTRWQAISLAFDLVI